MQQRSQPIFKKHKSTADQINHQLKFSVAISFVAALTSLVRITFKKYAIEMSEFNAAFAYNYHNAMAGKTPDYIAAMEQPKLLADDITDFF